MGREYIRIKSPARIPLSTSMLRTLSDEFWKNLVFYHLLSFYKNYDQAELKFKIQEEQNKTHPRVERLIAKYIRKYLKNNREFNLNLDVVGEATNDEEVEGNYDISIFNTYWANTFHFECKNLDDKQNLIKEYVFKRSKSDGGLYRYFNGKYAQNTSFGGMIGFVLKGDVHAIKTKIIKQMDLPFDITPEGKLIRVELDAIDKNDFTFSTFHLRKATEFKIYHLLFTLG